MSLNMPVINIYRVCENTLFIFEVSTWASKTVAFIGWVEIPMHVVSYVCCCKNNCDFECCRCYLFIQGAATQCFLAIHPSVKGVSGKYFQNCSFSKRSNEAKDPKVGYKLWEFSEKLISSKKFN